MALDLIPVRFTIKPTQMTIPNIGYKANSIYERDAIFDELEKMGHKIFGAARDTRHLNIAQQDEHGVFSAYPIVFKTTEYHPSPESFLAAAREALKPKEPAPNGTTYKERFLVSYISKIADQLADNRNKLEAERKQMREQMANLERSRDRLRLRVSQLEGNAEPKRETPPKIVGRKYRVASLGDFDEEHYAFKIGDVLTLVDDIESSMPYFLKQGGERPRCVHISRLELLPEEPWTAEYEKGRDVWVKATVRKVREGCLDVSVIGSRFCSTIHSPSIIKKA